MLGLIRRWVNRRKPPVVPQVEIATAPPEPECSMRTCLVCGRELAQGEAVILLLCTVGDLAERVQALACASCSQDGQRRDEAVRRRARQQMAWRMWRQARN